MNKFLVKKKGKDLSPVEDKSFYDTLSQSPLSTDSAAAAALSLPPPTPPPPPPPSSAANQKRGWLRKKPQTEAKPAFDLNSVLPSTDNFRTSLLMPNLSARFSMLREQDNPNSILGKASDDSVLHPKRRSRLGDYGFDNSIALTDIDEVSSLKPPRPLNPPRQASYTFGDERGTNSESPYSGSIMSRARPGEGNMLFGGRQKVYRIPVGDSGSVSTLGSGEGRGMRGRALYEDDISLSAFQRLRRKEKEDQQEVGARIESEDLSEMDVIPSHELEKFPSDLSLTGKIEATSSLQSGPSALSLSATAMSSDSRGVVSRTPSPVASVSTNPPIPEKSRSRKLYDQGLDQHLQEQQNAALSRLDSIKRGVATPGPQRLSHSRSAYNLNERSGTRAGVYASNANSAVHQAEPTPPSSRSRSPEGSGHTQKTNVLLQALDPSDRGKATAMGTFSKPKQFSEQQYLQRQLSLIRQQQQQQQQQKTVTDSHENGIGTQQDARSFSGPKKHSSSTNSQTDSPASSPSLRGVPSTYEMHLPQLDSFNMTTSRGGDSFDDQRNDVRSVETPRISDLSNEMRRTPPPMFKHPAMRAASQSQAYREKRNAWSPEALATKISESVDDSGSNDYFEFKRKAENERKDHKLLDENSGLTGLVREHLRHPSNQSSIYPPKSPAPWEQNTSDLDQTAVLRYSTMGPYDSDELETNPYAHDIGDLAINVSGRPDKEHGLKKQHNRVESSETQYERQAFASELAERQRTIQENLKIKVHNENRSPSPGSNRSGNDSSFMPFGLLRRPSSREATSPFSDAGGRTLGRKLGMPPNPGSSSPAGNGRIDDWRSRTASPSVIGRTLHSKMIRPTEEYGRTAPSTSTEGKSPSLRQSEDSTRSRAPLSNVSNYQEPKAFPVRISQPDTSRSSASRHRSSSEMSLEKQTMNQTKSSIDTERSRIDGSSSISNLYYMGERNPASSLDSICSPSRSSSVTSPPSISTSEQAVKAAQSPSHDKALSDTSKPWPPAIEVPYSAHSTPPLSAASSPNLDSSRTPSFTPSMLHNSANMRQQQQENAFNAAFKHSPSSTTKSPRRKGTFKKGEISEPTLLASTAKFDTVPLPPGATLMNGMKDDVDVVVLHEGRGLYNEDTASSPSMTKGSSGNVLFNSSSKKAFMKAFGRRPSAQSGNDDTLSQQSLSSSRKTETLASQQDPAELISIGSPKYVFSHMESGAPL